MEERTVVLVGSSGILCGILVSAIAMVIVAGSSQALWTLEKTLGILGRVAVANILITAVLYARLK